MNYSIQGKAMGQALNVIPRDVARGPTIYFL